MRKTKLFIYLAILLITIISCVVLIMWTPEAADAKTWSWGEVKAESVKHSKDWFAWTQTPMGKWYSSHAHDIGNDDLVFDDTTGDTWTGNVDSGGDPYSSGDDGSASSPGGGATSNEKKYKKKDNVVRSLVKDAFMGILIKKINTGSPILQFLEPKQVYIDKQEGKKEESAEDKRKQINWDLATGSANKTYSLYDRFGEGVSFSMYIGEKPVKTNMVDKIYTAISYHDDASKMKLENLIDLISQQDSEFTNIFYEGRPPLKTSVTDPRVWLYNNHLPINLIDGAVVGTANYFLNNAKVLTEICSFFVSPSLVQIMSSTIKGILESKTFTELKPAFNIIFLLMGVFLLIFILRFCFTFIKSGTASLKQFFMNLLCSLFSLGLVTMLVINPSALIDVTTKILTTGEELISNEINRENQDNEFVHSDETDNVLSAVLFQTAIFNPWVEGQFGEKYENLYTTTSGVDGTNKKIWEVSPEAEKAYGNIGVPINGKESDNIKNWAALMYSCHSVYHIDAVDYKHVESTGKVGEKANWPKATRPFDHEYIYNDDFRWIDALHKVGQFDKDPNTNKVNNAATDPYINYRYYNFDGVAAGWRAIWLSILLLPVGFLGLKKTLNILLALINFALLMYRSAINVIAPGKSEYSIKANLKHTFKPLVSYFFYLILTYIGIEMWKMWSYGNIFVQFFYLGLIIYMCTLKVDMLPQIGSKIKRIGAKAADVVGGINAWNVERKYKKLKKKLSRSVRESNSKSKHKEEELERGKEQYEKLKEDDNNNEDNDKHNNRSNLNRGHLTKKDYKNGYTRELERLVDNCKKLTSTEKNYAKNAYRSLCNELARTSIPNQIANAIDTHRASVGCAEYDEKVLGIPLNEAAAREEEYGNLERRQKVRSQKRDIAEMKEAINHKQENKDEKKIQKKADKLEKKYEDGKITKEEKDEKIKKLRDDKKKKREGKSAKKAKRDERYDKVQQNINKITGNDRGGSFISLRMKIRIALILLILWIIGWIVFLLFGG